MNLRSPLANARGLGSSKSGVNHWWGQRLSAIALVPLLLWFIASLVNILGADYATAIAWIQEPWTTILLVILIGTLFYHSQLGLRVIVEDYVHTEWLLVATLLLLKFLNILIALIGIYAVLHIAYAGPING
jgi:succinate dehydrogenase / fumarate reductase membrane anchor subunit